MKPLEAEQVWTVLHRGSSARLPPTVPANFKVGDAVRAKLMNHSGHIRLPEYVQDRKGVIVKDYGTFIFPDAHAKGQKEPQRLYNVRFESSQLWESDTGETSGAVHIDLFESYLKPA